MVRNLCGTQQRHESMLGKSTLLYAAEPTLLPIHVLYLTNQSHRLADITGFHVHVIQRGAGEGQHTHMHTNNKIT